MQHLKEWWKKCIDNEGDIVESNLNYAKAVPIIHAKFITIVLIVSKTKKHQEALLLYHPLYFVQAYDAFHLKSMLFQSP